jgi:hypothetical protein
MPRLFWSKSEEVNFNLTADGIQLEAGEYFFKHWRKAVPLSITLSLLFLLPHLSTHVPLVFSSNRIVQLFYGLVYFALFFLSIVAVTPLVKASSQPGQDCYLKVIQDTSV